MTTIQIGMLLFGVFGYWWHGLTYDFAQVQVHATFVCLFLATWGYYALWPGKQAGDWVTAETFLALALFVSIGAIAVPSQYAAVAFRRPLVDPWLAAFDAALGLNVAALTAWTREHLRWFAPVLLYAYISLIAQFFLTIFALGFWHRNRRAMWEYLFHFHVCSAITLACLALWPAACAFSYYGFTSLFNQSRFIEQFGGVYAGTLTNIRAADMEGLVSVPSFHVAGALMTTRALWDHIGWRWILVPLNVVLVASTVLSGAHYFADWAATLVMCGVSMWLYQRYGREVTESTPLPRAARVGTESHASPAFS